MRMIWKKLLTGCFAQLISGIDTISQGVMVRRAETTSRASDLAASCLRGAWPEQRGEQTGSKKMNRGALTASSLASCLLLVYVSAEVRIKEGA